MVVKDNLAKWKVYCKKKQVLALKIKKKKKIPYCMLLRPQKWYLKNMIYQIWRSTLINNMPNLMIILTIIFITSKLHANQDTNNSIESYRNALQKWLRRFTRSPSRRIMGWLVLYLTNYIIRHYTNVVEQKIFFFILTPKIPSIFLTNFCSFWPSWRNPFLYQKNMRTWGINCRVLKLLCWTSTSKNYSSSFLGI
jgi:hypothetical protein